MATQAEPIRFSSVIQVGEDKVKMSFEYRDGEITTRSIMNEPKNESKETEITEQEYYFASLDCVNDENC